MIDGNQLREEFGRYLAEHKATRWGMDAALMHVCKIAYDAGKADGPGAALHSREYEIEVPAEPGLHPLKFTGLPLQNWRDEQLLAHIQRGAVLEGWKEATIAWEVCASIHREYAKKKDPFFTTRQADFVKHTEAARSALLAAAPDHFRDAAKMMAEPAEVPMPQGYVERPSDYTGDIWIESQMRTYGAACRAAGEAAGYAHAIKVIKRLRDSHQTATGECQSDCDFVTAWDSAIDALRGEVKP